MKRWSHICTFPYIPAQPTIQQLEDKVVYRDDILSGRGQDRPFPAYMNQAGPSAQISAAALQFVISHFFFHHPQRPSGEPGSIVNTPCITSPLSAPFFASFHIFRPQVVLRSLLLISLHRKKPDLCRNLSVLLQHKLILHVCFHFELP